jgi:DNA-binding response OmpR family regulator
MVGNHPSSSAGLSTCCPVCGGEIRTAELALVSEELIVVRNRQAVRLSRREFQLLECLNRSPCRTVTHGQILDHIYGLESDEPDWHILSIMVHRLRKKVAPLGLTIETVWGQGFALKSSDLPHNA